MSLRDTLKKHDFKFKKKFGQNFISDPGLLQKIVNTGQVTKEDVVVEIGPGAGTLTKALAKQAKQVIAIEIDNDLIPLLQDELKEFDNIRLVHGDALHVNLDEVVEETMGEKRNYKVVANLPYYITTPLVMHFLESGYAIDRIVIMVQKEVAERFKAVPGKKDYGAITVALNYYGKVSMAFVVPRKMFTPQPDVDSAVVDIELWKEKPVQAESQKLFQQVVRAAFNQRRKTLNNALKTLGYSTEVMNEALVGCNIDPKRRGETLSIEEFAALSNALYAARDK